MSESVVLYSTLVTNERNRFPTQWRKSMFRRSPVNREPYTTRALPLSTGASSFGQSSGSYSRSASWISTRSPVTAPSPVRTAAPLPRLCGWNTTRTVLSPSWDRTSRVPSSLPSSTITISRSIGRSTPRIRRTTSATVFRSLKTGTMTDSFRSGAPGAPGASVPLPLTFASVPGIRAGQTFAELDLRAPTEDALGEPDVGTAAHRIIDGQRLVDDGRFGAGDLQDELGELADRELVGVADVHRPVPVRLQERQQPADLVVDVAERARLAPVSVDRERAAVRRLGDEVRHDASVAVAQA